VFDVGRATSEIEIDPRLGRGRRAFEFVIKTNGYAAHVQTSIPAPLQRDHHPPLKNMHTLIGIDPGLSCLYTAYSRSLPHVWYNPSEASCPKPGWCCTCPGHHGGGRRHGKKRPRNRRRGRRNRRRRSLAKCDVVGYCAICDRHHPKRHPRKHGVRRRDHFLHDNAHVQQATSRVYRHLARIQHHAYWFENFKKRNADYKPFLMDTPLWWSRSARILGIPTHTHCAQTPTNGGGAPTAV
jgi:hypothetical protein